MAETGYTDKIRTWLCANPERTATVLEIAEAVGVTNAQARTALPNLCKQGEVERIKRGTYACAKSKKRKRRARPDEETLIARQEAEGRAPQPTSEPTSIPDEAWNIVHEFANGDFILVRGDDGFMCRKM